MAAGYAFVTGRGQGVLVHVDVGTANTATAMHNLFRSRLPVLLMAGKAPYTTGNELVGSRDTYVHFVQEPFDQGSLVRPYLKWEWTLPSGVVVKEALRRAHSIMQSEPQGPVYLMMQRETLTQPWSVDDVRRFDAEQHGSTAGGGADPELIDAARRPADRGREPDPDHRLCRPQSRAPSELIAELAEFAGIAVFEVEHDQQHLARQPVLPRLSARQASAQGRRRPPGRRRRAVVPERRRGQREHVLGPHRRRHAQAGLADVDVPGQSAHAGRQRAHPRAGCSRS